MIKAHKIRLRPTPEQAAYFAKAVGTSRFVWNWANPKCVYYQFEQDRDHNAGHNILREALRLIGLIDQVASGIGSDKGVNSAVDLM